MKPTSAKCRGHLEKTTKLYGADGACVLQYALAVNLLQRVSHVLNQVVNDLDRWAETQSSVMSLD